MSCFTPAQLRSLANIYCKARFGCGLSDLDFTEQVDKVITEGGGVVDVCEECRRLGDKYDLDIIND